MALGIVLGTNGNRAICRFDQAELIATRRAQVGGSLAATSIGGICKITTGNELVLGTLADLSSDPADSSGVIAEIEFIGEGARDTAGKLGDFRRGVSAYPHPGDVVNFAEADDFQLIFAPPDLPHINVGTIHPTDNIRAPILFDRLLGRHFAIVGSSGTGKSTSVALLLSRILENAAHGHILILDPHGEYSAAFGASAKVWNVENLELPFWVMNLEEHCEAFITAQSADALVDRNILAKCLQRARARNVRISDAARVTADSPVAYQVSDLIQAIEEEAGRLEKIADVSRYTQLRLTIEQYFADQRYRFIFNPEWFSSSLEGLLGEILRIPDAGQPISIIDLAGVPTEIVNVVVSTIARLTLDFAIRSPRHHRAPTLLLCEEAHRYLPRKATADTTGVRRQLERIAREGRKYGVCLGIVTQRPSELSEVVLSQCGTIIALRLNNREDQEQVRSCMSEGAKSLVGVIAALQNRECIISGEGVPIPMRVLIDVVPDAQKPDSSDELFSQRWQDTAIGTQDVARTVKAWREGH